MLFAGSLPVATATLSTRPRSRSAWVTVWVAEQLAEAEGAKTVESQMIDPVSATGSETVRLWMVTLPSLRTVIV